MGKAHFCRDGGRCGEVIDYLVGRKFTVNDVLGHESPEEVEARRLFVLVFDPASSFECSSDISVATFDDEDFGVGVDTILFLPFLHVRDVELSWRHHLLVALKEIVESF